MPGFAPPLLGPLLMHLAKHEQAQQQMPMQPAPAPPMPGYSMEIGQSGSGVKMKKTVDPGQPPAAPTPQPSLFQSVLLGLLGGK